VRPYAQNFGGINSKEFPEAGVKMAISVFPHLL
jgi:hypothetical protein